MKKSALFLYLLVSFSLFAGCSDPIATGSSQPTPKSIDGYLAVQTNNVTWVTLLVTSGGTVSGQWIANDAQNGVGVQTIFPLTGTFEQGNNNISLTLQGNLGVTINITGTFKNNVLNLDIQQNGSIKHEVLSGTAMSDYQAALTAFHKKYPLGTPKA